MKIFTEILKDIQKVEAEVKTAKQYKNELDAAHKEKIRGKLFKDFKEEIGKELEAYAKATSENAQKLNDLTVSLHILHNNAKIALFNEVIPAVIEVFNKYVNKPYGEKTEEKISNEIVEKTGFRCYIRRHYSTQTLEIIPIKSCGYDYSISVGRKNGNDALLTDNKIQKFGVEDLGLWYISEEYVEDVQKRVDELNAAYTQILVAKKELENCCEKFNSLVVGDIKRINENDHLYSNLIY